MHPHATGAFTKFAASSWGKKLARQAAKAKQNDFDRFKATLAKVSTNLRIRTDVHLPCHFILHGMACIARSDFMLCASPPPPQVKKARVVRKVVNQLKKAASKTKAAPKKK